MKPIKIARFQNPLRSGGFRRQNALTDEEFIEWQVVIEEMTERQLKNFAASPDNKELLLRYRAYLRRRLMPYVGALVFAFVLSVVAGILIAW
ncbi:hypothetical protein [Roseibium sp.]|uniref:hypothetical protein n=1 Tax=Roseibium sp. TaxID=1936156 RepID=UPI003299EB83